MTSCLCCSGPRTQQAWILGPGAKSSGQEQRPAAHLPTDAGVCTATAPPTREGGGTAAPGPSQPGTLCTGMAAGQPPPSPLPAAAFPPAHPLRPSGSAPFQVCHGPRPTLTPVRVTQQAGTYVPPHPRAQNWAGAQQACGERGQRPVQACAAGRQSSHPAEVGSIPRRCPRAPS